MIQTTAGNNNIIHVFIYLRFAKDISSIFKVGNTCTYIYFLSGSCVLLFICSSLDPEVLSQFLPVTFITFGNLIQTSIIYELVTAVSDRLPATVYNTPWELMDNGNRRTLLIFLQRLQTPVRIEAFGSLKIGLESMAAILKTTFSYYLFLKTVSDD
uniref:Putative odorant receptor 39 n=1 Tax=Conopomorpha sinensis TaxID=940481 RepID=A0A3Q8HDF9_9NEOP|nr:putative odorant receptor 39 [Conopomorpha sinensis]